jgi:uncharacterized protein YndB with AHSA1/START domain
VTSFTLVRRIKASPAIVFDAVTTAEGIAHWWGPDEGPVLLSESEPRVGGRYRLRFRKLDDTEHECSGEFLVVEPPRRVVLTWRWVFGGADPGQSQVEILLRAIGDGTELTFSHSLLHDEASCRSHEGGWTGALRKLDLYLARIAASQTR